MMKGLRGHLGTVYIDGSHHETVANCPGANDNASGVAVMLELARFFSTKKVGVRIIFLSTCAEECACFGMERYLKTKKAALALTKAAYVIDQVAGGNAGILRRGIEYDIRRDLMPTKNYFVSDKALVQALRKSAKRLGYHLPVYDKAGGGLGEAETFIKNGVPSVFLCGWNTDLAYHTPLDSIDKVSANGLKSFADIVADSIMSNFT
jgi:aminopeptidase YwaD